MEFYKLQVQSIERQTADSVQIDFKLPSDPDTNWGFEPGQYLVLEHMIDGEAVRRSYSICSYATQTSTISVGIKEVPGGKFSTFANRDLEIGQNLKVAAPQGNFKLQQRSNKNHYLFFAAGSGITPILSMMEHVLRTRPESQVSLFYGNQTVRSIMFLEAIEDLKNGYMTRLNAHHVLSRQVQDTELFSGRIDAAKVEDWSKYLYKPAEVHSCYLCGPEQMIVGVRNALINLDIDKQSIVFELFTSDKAKQARSERKEALKGSDHNTQSNVTIHLHGKEIVFPFSKEEDNLLDAALEQGADLPFACKGGVCCTCKARVTEGDVKMYVNYGLEPDEIDAGFVLTCQAFPTSDEVTIDFDAI